MMSLPPGQRDAAAAGGPLTAGRPEGRYGLRVIAKGKAPTAALAIARPEC